ncbi:MAG: hypothetical protein ACLP0H_18340 [Terriglobales bacterium]
MKERGRTEPSWIEPIVARVVGQVLDSHVSQLRSEIVRQVMEEIAAAPVDETTSADPANCVSSSNLSDLARAVAEIQLGSSQKEILRALLDTTARYASRVALFVVKGSHATGWQARGFANNEAAKDFKLDENAPAVGRAIGERVVASAQVADLDSRFLAEFGTPASGEARLLPLILKDKVAALVYADGGTDDQGLLDAGALDLLVLSTSAWLEVNALRKQAQKDPSASHSSGHQESQSVSGSQAASAAPPFNDPFASHAPAFASGQAMAAAASAGEISAPVASAAAPISNPIMGEAQSVAPEVQSAVAEMEAPLAEPIAVDHAEVKPAPETSSGPSMSTEDQAVHGKAQRFARLLVDEIKLYNQAKVAEGRKNKDLYDRLKETIEKSRATYQKRYGNTIAASGNYFQHEIIRSLAEDDPSIMGANFRR